MKWFWDERGYYVSQKELRDDFKGMKERGEIDEKVTFKGYVTNCISGNGTLRKCENMFCRDCIDALYSRGESFWKRTGCYADAEGKCDWCGEKDYLTEVRFD